MRGFLSVEEEYYRNLELYYASLQMGLPMDYYSGRNDPDLTPWLSYFVETIALAARRVEERARAFSQPLGKKSAPWESLSRPQQQLLNRLLLADETAGEVPVFSPAELAEWFGVTTQSARAWLQDWSKVGFVTAASGVERIRLWRLGDEYADLVGAARRRRLTDDGK